MDYSNSNGIAIFMNRTANPPESLDPQFQWYWLKLVELFNSYVIPNLVTATRKEINRLWTQFNQTNYHILNFTPDSHPNVYLLLKMNYTSYPRLKSINMNMTKFERTVKYFIRDQRSFSLLGRRLAERRREYIFNHLFLFYTLSLFVVVVCPLLVLLVLLAFRRSRSHRSSQS